MANLDFTLNGKPISVEVKPNEFLAEVLRYRLGMTGTKVGCNEAECGICTVIVDGQSVNSCVYPALKAQGRRIETIEGLANGHLHPLQETFIKYGAVQCGFCTPGVIMQSKALLDRKQGQPVTDEEIKIALKDTYCRCTGYVAIVNAVKAANGQDVSLEEYLPETKHGYNVVGEALPRADSVAKVTGAAIYTDDVVFPDMLWAATLRANIPHALIKKIDTSKAKALPGVHAVLTHEDVPGRKNHGLVTIDWPVLCYDKVRYVGDAVAIVAADTLDIAKDALKLIEVEYEPLPVVDIAEYAHQPDAPKVHEKGNLLKHIKVVKGDVEQGFAESDVVIERAYHTASTEHAFLEPECAVGRMTDDGRYEIYVGSQISYQDREQVAYSLGVPESQVRIIGTLIGGGFGGKEDIMGQIHVALLAKATGHPVKMLYTRHESLIVHPKRHATTITVKIGAKKDGRLVASESGVVWRHGRIRVAGRKGVDARDDARQRPVRRALRQVRLLCDVHQQRPGGRVPWLWRHAVGVCRRDDDGRTGRTVGRRPDRAAQDERAAGRLATNTNQLLTESVGLDECLDKVVDAMKAEERPNR